MTKTLIIVDCQYDFLPEGNLAVERGDEIIPIINQLIKDYDLIIFTRDFHPVNHKSFASQNTGKNIFDQIKLESGKMQTLWPDHCIQGTRGSHIHDDLIGNPDLKNKEVYIFRKGMDYLFDSHSGFKDSNGVKTGLGDFLKERKIINLDICGLATDICVFMTAEDAVEEGFKPSVILEASRGLDPNWSTKNLTDLNIKIK